jgi:hypothetical protein
MRWIVQAFRSSTIQSRTTRDLRYFDRDSGSQGYPEKDFLRSWKNLAARFAKYNPYVPLGCLHELAIHHVITPAQLARILVRGHPRSLSPNGELYPANVYSEPVDAALLFPLDLMLHKREYIREGVAPRLPTSGPEDLLAAYCTIHRHVLEGEAWPVFLDRTFKDFKGRTDVRCAFTAENSPQAEQVQERVTLFRNGLFAFHHGLHFKDKGPIPQAKAEFAEALLDLGKAHITPHQLDVWKSEKVRQIQKQCYIADFAAGNGMFARESMAGLGRGQLPFFDCWWPHRRIRLQATAANSSLLLARRSSSLKTNVCRLTCIEGRLQASEQTYGRPTSIDCSMKMLMSTDHRASYIAQSTALRWKPCLWRCCCS